jgi:hypothetical protein
MLSMACATAYGLAPGQCKYLGCAGLAASEELLLLLPLLLLPLLLLPLLLLPLLLLRRRWHIRRQQACSLKAAGKAAWVLSCQQENVHFREEHIVSHGKSQHATQRAGPAQHESSA